MPSLKRVKSNYPGVFFIEGTSPVTGKPARIYYIRYRKAGKMIEEKAGRQFDDDMTPARANTLRTDRIRGKKPIRKEARERQEAAKKAEAARWTVDRLWQEYSSQKHDSKGLKVDLYTLQKLLTHTSAALTQRYAHLRDEALHRASKLAGKLFNQATTGLNGNDHKLININGNKVEKKYLIYAKGWSFPE